MVGQSEDGYIDVDEERQKLIAINPLMIVDYIKSSFDILLNLRVEDALFEQEQEMQMMRIEAEGRSQERH